MSNKHKVTNIFSYIEEMENRPTTTDLLPQHIAYINFYRPVIIILIRKSHEILIIARYPADPAAIRTVFMAQKGKKKGNHHYSFSNSFICSASLLSCSCFLTNSAVSCFIFSPLSVPLSASSSMSSNSTKSFTI